MDLSARPSPASVTLMQDVGPDVVFFAMSLFTGDAFLLACHRTNGEVGRITGACLRSLYGHCMAA